MASNSPLAAILLTLIPCLFLVIPQAEAQPTPGPAPAPSSTLNLTAILENGGQYSTLIQILRSTGLDTQIYNQLNNSNQGLTLFAPTDNAFNNLNQGTINSLTQQQQTELVWYHVLPEYYSIANLEIVSNPVRTEGTNKNGVDTLNFTRSSNNQVNVTSGLVTTPLNNPLRQKYPLGVYEVDKVLLPESLFGKSSAPAPAPAAIAKNTSTTPSVSTGGGSSGSNGRNVGLGMVAGIGLFCMGFLLQ
ncbi:hypothetical protein NE237_001526 [Protea cynaroides]|uniref:FAS1 domain-containing protein n=1 Tax=Protea cynaroides TaxID=273540 RepID=A0A9Q0QY71_9MAGN|nr:hypothetical protein NE237_001526 [Protea cynaroides]